MSLIPDLPSPCGRPAMKVLLQLIMGLPQGSRLCACPPHSCFWTAPAYFRCTPQARAPACLHDRVVIESAVCARDITDLLSPAG